MSFVKITKFARFNADGVLERLQCKLCGDVIGEIQLRPVGRKQRPDGRIVEKIVENFTRNDQYTEIKIAFEDGSAHVTNGCKRCLTGQLSVEQLEALTYTDEDDLGMKRTGRKPMGVVKTLVGGGIV
jgi:hypothetical protein